MVVKLELEGAVYLVEYDDDGNVKKRDWNPITIAILWESMVVGINRITVENWQTWYIRHRMAFDTDFSVVQEEPLTIEQVKGHVGFSCNVDDLNDLAFMAKMASRAFERMQRQFKRDLEEHDETLQVEHNPYMRRVDQRELEELY